MIRSQIYITVPPGETIKELLEDRQMNPEQFAALMNWTEEQACLLLDGQIPLTAKTADMLEAVLGIPSQFWNNLEAIYRDKLIKAEAENLLDSGNGKRDFP